MGSKKHKHKEKTSNIPQVTDTLFHKVYRLHLTMGSEKYKFKEKTNSLPQVTDTPCFEIKCVSHLRNVTGFLFVLIFFTSHGQVYSIQPHEKKYVSNLRNVTGFLCALIFFTSHDQVYSINLMKQGVSVTCGRLFVRENQ
jgi:hypothetical protein